MPSRAVTSFLQAEKGVFMKARDNCVNALSGCYLISTLILVIIIVTSGERCQCPLGLLPHFYSLRVTKRSDAVDTGVNALSGCYLISTLSTSTINTICKCVNALSGCYLISTPRRRSTMTRQRIVSMPSRAVTSFLPR